MPFPSALDSTAQTLLRGDSSTPPTYAANQYILLNSNTTVFAARVNQATFAASFAQVTFDTVTTGAYTDIQIGMTVLISRTNDKRAAYFVGRVRKTPTSAILYINETSATIADNDYIFVIRDFGRLFHELGRVSGSTYYKDYDATFSQLKPIIYGLQSVYAGVVSGSPAGFTVAFAASAVAATSSATISTYAYTLPSGTTVTAGSTATASVTVRFDASATEYWVKLVVTDSGGRTQTRWMCVWAIPADLSTTIYADFSGARIDGDIEGGWTASITGFNGVDSVLDNTLCCILDVEHYNGTQTSITSAVKFVGRLRKESSNTAADETFGLLKETTYEVEGVSAQLARLSAPNITMIDAASPAVWDEILKLTIWRGITYLLEHSTFHHFFSLSFDSTSNAFRAYRLLTPQGNLLDAIKDIASAINANIEFSPTGEMRVYRDARYLDDTARDALVTVLDMTSADWTEFALDVDHVETVGLIQADGGVYNPTGGGIVESAVTPILSIAPGVAQGNADGISRLNKQILTADTAISVAKDELNTRTGNSFAIANGSPELQVRHTDGFGFLVPSFSQWYTFTIGASENTAGRVYTTSERWLCKAVSIEHDNETGGREVSATYILETSGDDAGAAGQTQEFPPEAETPPYVPYVPPTTGYPNIPPIFPYTPTTPITQLPPNAPVQTTPTNGNAVVIASDSHIWMTTRFKRSDRRWYDITPADFTGVIRDFGLIGYGGYLLTTSGSTSKFYYSANVFSTSIEWTTTSLLGAYQSLEPTSTDGGVYIYSSSSSEQTTVVNSTTGGNGNNTGISITSGDVVDIITNTTLWQYTTGQYCDADGVTPYDAGSDPNNSFLTLPAANPGALLYRIGTTGSWALAGTTVSFTAATTDTLYLIMNEYSVGAGYTDNAESLVSSVVINGSSGSALTRYSSDRGENFGVVRTVGASAVSTRVAAITIGTSVIVGTTGKVRSATSGGAWADYGSAIPTSTTPTALVIPRYQFGSTTTGNTSTATPQYLMGSGTLGAANEGVLKVTASGATFTDITPSVSGNYGLAISPRSLAMPWWSGSHIAGVLDFGGSPRLVTSTNAGSSWTDRGILDDDASMVVYRKGDRTMNELYIANGGPAYSPNRGSTITTVGYPADSATEPIILIAVYG